MSTWREASVVSSFILTPCSYWDWSRDASKTNNHSTAIFETDIFSPTVGFGGDGSFVEIAPENDRLGFNTL